MDSILAALNHWHQSTEFAASVPWLRLVATVLAGGVYCAAGFAVQRDDLLAALRQAIADAGLQEKQVATGSKGLLSQKLSGVRPLTFDALAEMPVPVIQWFTVRLCERVGIPSTVLTGARLARRQARMTLRATSQKAGVA